MRRTGEPRAELHPCFAAAEQERSQSQKVDRTDHTTHNTATHNTPTTTQQHTNTPTHQQLSISQSNIRRRPKLISQHRSQPVACRSYFCFLALELRWIDCSLVVVGFCLVCTFVTFVLSSHRRLPALPVVACNLCCVAVCEECGVGWLCRGDRPIHG